MAEAENMVEPGRKYEEGSRSLDNHLGRVSTRQRSLDNEGALVIREAFNKVQ